MSSIYREKEIELRNIISEKLQRGKIEISIWRENKDASSKYTVNNKVISDYFLQIKKIQEDLNITSSYNIISNLLAMPNAIQKGEEKPNENEWCEIQKGVEAAIANLLKFRLCEGKKLELDIQSRIEELVKLLNKIRPLAKERIEKVKIILSKKLADLDTKNIDENRFEQELVYYLEKQDITEEQIRLAAHLDYFTETINTESPNGKKLGFIAQEIGREINTIGSKSSNLDMQKIVVQMKDELEKIKEQLLNIL
jgi:uncharacterized protein (TIGR00255 family)